MAGNWTIGTTIRLQQKLTKINYVHIIKVIKIWNLKNIEEHKLQK